MEKRKAIYKKIIAILCVFVILQSYFSAFAQVVYALEEEINENSDETSLFSPSGNNVDPTLGGVEEEQEAEETEENEESALQEENYEEELNVEVSGEEENIEETEEDTEEGTEEYEEEISEENVEETVEEQAVENIETPVEEIVEEEPYVDPEVTVEVTSENTSIYKGYLYANATSELKYTTDYNTIDRVTIVGGKNISSLTIQDEPDKMQLITNIKIGLMNQMYYRQTRISVDEFNSILGENGSINIYTPEGEILGNINKDSEVRDNEYIFTYPMQLDSVKIEFTNIISDGTISIKNDKSIKESTDFSRNQISLFASINTIAGVNLYVGEELRSSSYEGNINLEETESRMILEIDKETLSTEEINELAISVTLKTDEERYDLFENPTIEIEFPSAVEEVEVTGINLLYKNGLTIGDWNVGTNAIGKKVLKLNLEGAQLEYTPGAVQQGTTLVVYVDVDVDRLTTDTSEVLKMTYTNKDTVRKTYSLEGRDSEDVEIGFVGRQELLRSMKIENEEGINVVSYDENTEKIQIKANEDETLTVTGTIVNNYEATISDVIILGRIPFVGNKDGYGNDLETNFDAKLQNALSTSGVIADVYYSEDGFAEANSDTWVSEIEDFSNIKSYKIVVREKTLAKGEKLSFEYKLNIPEEVRYNAVCYTNYFVNYKLDEQSYMSQCAIGMYSETKEVTMEDIQEEAKEEVAELTIGTQVSQCGRVLTEEDTVYERQVLKYTVVVRNTSNITATNILIRGKAENANLYVWNLENLNDFDDVYVKAMKEFSKEEKEYEDFTIESLAPGESKTFEYEVIVDEKENEEENKEVYGKLIVSADSISDYMVNTFKNKIESAKLSVRTENNSTQSLNGEEFVSGSAMNLKGIIKNISNEDLLNVSYTILIPMEAEFQRNFIICDNEDVSFNIEENEKNKIVVFNIPKLKSREELIIYYSLSLNSFEYTEAEEILNLETFAEVDNIRYLANDYVKTIYQSETKIEYNFSSNVDKEIVENEDEIKFTLEILNIGNVKTHTYFVKSEMPNGLFLQSAKIIKEDDIEDIEISNNKELYITTLIEPNKNIKIEFIAKVNEEDYVINQDLLEIQANLNSVDESYKTDIISYRINNTNVSYEEESIDEDNYMDYPIIDEENLNNNQEQAIDESEIIDDNQNLNDESNNEIKNNTENIENQVIDNTNSLENNEKQITTKRTYTISGKVWLDKNKNGINDADELGRESVIVYLYKATNEGGIDTSNKVSTTTTNKEGEYVFTGVEEGKYVIVFSYASNIYSITKYQVSTAKSNENSDVVSKNLTLDQETEIYGITDVIEVTNGSIINIDMGLVEKNEFDLSLKKKISKITVINDEGTKDYNYEDVENVKIEIKSKYYKSTTLDITYKILVKNEGEVSGYVNKIVDYMPEGMTIDYKNSPGWYQSPDGNIYYTGLTGKEIQPGQEEIVEIKLKKSLEDGKAAKLVNGAEIAEFTNANGLDDKDSIENNKFEKEDDYGKAILIVSISTGNTLQNIVSILIVIIMISVIVIIAVKYKNTKKVYR